MRDLTSWAPTDQMKKKERNLVPLDICMNSTSCGLVCRVVTILKIDDKCEFDFLPRFSSKINYFDRLLRTSFLPILPKERMGEDDLFCFFFITDRHVLPPTLEEILLQ